MARLCDRYCIQHGLARDIAHFPGNTLPGLLETGPYGEAFQDHSGCYAIAVTVGIVSNFFGLFSRGGTEISVELLA